LEHALQRREIHYHHLPEQTPCHSVIEHFVVEDADFAVEDGLGVGAARQCVEHVEEDKAGEGHGCVARGDFVVVGHFTVVGEEGAEHDDCGGLEDALDEGASKDAGVAVARGLGHYGGVNGLNAEGLSRWAIHENVWWNC
jgi:hypothetical protein